MTGTSEIDLRKHNVKDAGGRSRKKDEGDEDQSKGMYEAVDDRKTVVFENPISLTTPLGIQREVSLVFVSYEVT